MLIFLNSVCANLITAATTTTSAVSGANLNVTISGFPQNDVLHYEVLDRYIENYDVLSTTKINDSLYEFEMLFYINFTTNFYTSYRANNVFDSVNSDPVNREYLSLKLCTSPSNSKTYQPTKHYYIRYNEYDLSQSNLIAQGFSGNIQIDADFTLPADYSFNVDKEEFDISTQSIVATTERIAVTSNRISKIGCYEDVFYQNELTDLGQVNSMSTTRYGEAEIKDNIGDLGFTARDTNIYTVFESGMPYQPENLCLTKGKDDLVSVSTDSEGNVVQSANNAYVSLMPDIFLYKQSFSFYSRSYATVDTSNDWWDFGHYGWLSESKYTAPIDRSENEKRTIGWTVQNYNMQHNYLALVRVKAITELTLNQEYRFDADDPNLQLGDIYWDDFVEGDGFTIHTSEDTWSRFAEENWYIFVIIGVVVVGVAYFYLRSTGLIGGGDFTISIGNRH